jgi:hypothetical protein
VVYAFRGSVEGDKTHLFRLQGLQPSSRYQLKFNDRSATDRTATGEQLMRDGLQVTLGLPNSSELIFLEAEAK